MIQAGIPVKIPHITKLKMPNTRIKVPRWGSKLLWDVLGGRVVFDFLAANKQEIATNTPAKLPDNQAPRRMIYSTKLKSGLLDTGSKIFTDWYIDAIVERENPIIAKQANMFFIVLTRTKHWQTADNHPTPISRDPRNRVLLGHGFFVNREAPNLQVKHGGQDSRGNGQPL